MWEGHYKAGEVGRGHACPQSLHLARGAREPMRTTAVSCTDAGGGWVTAWKAEVRVNSLPPPPLDTVICGSGSRWAAAP